MKKIIYKAALIFTVITGSGFGVLYLFWEIKKITPHWSVFGGVFLVCLAIFLLFTHHHTKYIVKINNQVQSYANGDLTARVITLNDDELGQLNTSLQSMAENLHQRMQQTLQEKGQMETILASMAEGVLAFDITGKLLLINKTAENMLNVVWEEVREHYFLEILENYHIAYLLNKCLVHGEAQTAEVKLSLEDTEYYHVYITPIKGENGLPHGTVMVLRNITKLRKLEQMRSEFISNVSHELRTPLTSIKGFVETLLDGAQEDKELATKFLTIINMETDRLNTLISDLLFLSKLESGDMEIIKVKIEARALVEKIITLLEPVAWHKNIRLESEIKTGAEFFYASYEMIEQVLINLVDNAIKYSHEDGVVKIVLRPGEKIRQEEQIVIEVIDQGIGIPSQSLSRIFERFYRVDKARSRQVGGTGLGLSIVKHIVERHHGRVQVKSQENEGSDFMIILPKV